MSNKWRIRLREHWLEVLLISLSCILATAIVIQVRINSHSREVASLGLATTQIKLSDVEVAPLISLISYSSERQWALIVFDRRAHVDTTIVEYLEYLAGSLPSDISVHLVTLADNPELGTRLSHVQHHVDPEMNSFRVTLSTQLRWASCLIILDPERRPAYIKLNPQRSDIALFISTHVARASLNRCNSSTLSLNNLLISSLIDSSHMSISNGTYLVIYPSACFGCGDDILLKSIEGRLRNNTSRQAEESTLKIPLFLFPKISDQNKLRGYLYSEFSSLMQSSLAFGLFDLPPGDCIRIRSCYEIPLILEVMKDHEARVIGPRDLLKAIDLEMR